MDAGVFFRLFMASAPAASTYWKTTLWIWAFALLGWGKIWADRRWPGSRTADILSYALTAFFLAGFATKVWTGYRRRRPHWTRDSWRRYFRLAAMPVVVLIVLFSELYLFDSGGYRTIFGAAGSGLRLMWIAIDVVMILAGAIGCATALSWLTSGEPSEQFTRTRWFRSTTNN